MTTPGTNELPTPQWAADVRPGDTLVIGFDQLFSDEEDSWLCSRFAEALPGVKVVLVSSCSSMAVQRAGEARR